MNNVLVCKSNLRHDFITGKNKLPYFSGPTYLDAGYIFVPYIPMITTEDVVSDYQPNNNVTSRYSTVMVDNRYYGTITASDWDV
tara:strand:+ start:5516 stop:5767 length:252 start_codon:yes stop_codon:yes gene_type:complete